MNPDDKDGALLQQLKSVKLVWVDGYEGRSLVRRDNIAPTLMALILKVAPELEPFQIGDARYVLPLERVLAAEDSWRLVNARMRIRSL